MNRHNKSFEKSKNFGSAIKRLLKELSRYRIVIIIAIILAIASSILSIIAPDKLSELTDKISEGLIVKKDNMSKITNTITASFQNMNVTELLTSEQVSNEDKTILINIISSIEKGDKTQSINNFSKLSNELLNEILKRFTIDGNEINIEDQVKYLMILNTLDENSTPNELYKKIDEMPLSIQKSIKPSMNLDKIKTIVIIIAII